MSHSELLPFRLDHTAAAGLLPFRLTDWGAAALPLHVRPPVGFDQRGLAPSDSIRLSAHGEYGGVAARQDKDRDVLIALAGNGCSKVAIELCKGTQFGNIWHWAWPSTRTMERRPSAPSTADNMMAAFVEPRSEDVFRLFGQMSEVRR